MSSEPGSGLLVLLVAMAISMALIPLLIRYAPVLGMMDKPDPRKVHTVPIPRVGGVGIVLGALLPMAVWLPWNDLTISFLLGSAVLLVFGIWDDVRELGHYVKFVGQLIAVLLVVYHGDLYVSHLPLMGLEPVNEAFGRIFTVVAMVGVINAINHSDGLDGLAGGESMLSLGAIFYLAYQVDDAVVMLISLATMGGVFGFLRFNSYPARVFMGDGGSQFIGFALAFLVVYLTQISNPALSPALPALLLGLPVVDILSVFAQRVYAGMNWFRATKNHTHHRLLKLGFQHHESVMLIYSIQTFFVISAVLLSYESDGLLLSIYLGVCAGLFGFLIIAERMHWRLHSGRGETEIEKLIAGMDSDGILMLANRKMIQVLISAFLVLGSLSVTVVPDDLSVSAAVLFVLLLTRLIFGYHVWFLFLRLILFVAVAFVVYLMGLYPPDFLVQHSSPVYLFYGLTGLATALAVRVSRQEFFQVTPLDYLTLLIVIVMGVVSETGHLEESVLGVIIELIILFYGTEVVIRHMRSRWNSLTLSTLLSLGVMAVRGVFWSN